MAVDISLRLRWSRKSKLAMMRKPAAQSSRTIYRSSKKSTQTIVTIIYLFVFLPISVGVIFLISKGENLTIGGVPVFIVLDFLQDETARTAYFEGDAKKLHNRLEKMGVEEEIKDFYRPEIPDEVELDQYIHQLLYERTGYVGEAYQVNSKGILVLKKNR
ncbi:hypothetical protein [Lyngbya aestuarii]|uniref:hypothetical protein n=1 Tax=Lyngbya aestuarii TaxID=118322 RepID=UPI00403DBA28